ncbi:TrmH family RNA methyltransferase [Spongisporangium articulatum]|uniref:TrmH family RNA methyltransferase n=1 Tax=Spongisporangium articulatum TaxID=3362603 RepID=A0ABW8ARP6_9ACTN
MTQQAGPIEVDEPDDPRLADYTDLTDVALRTAREPAEGLYMAESEKVIRRALAAGHRPRSLLLSHRWLEPMADLVDEVSATGAPVYTGPAAVVDAIAGFRVHRGAIAAMHRPSLPTVPGLLQTLAASGRPARRLVVLEDVVDHTNVGAIVRSCAGLGADAVLVTPRCADPLYRRAVRVSMGTVFQVPWTRTGPWPEDVKTLQAEGFTVAALALKDSVDLDQLAANPPEKLALVLGTEGDGLGAGTTAAADVSVRIPMSGGVDSLNVAAAAAVAMWSLRVPPVSGSA